MKEKEIKLNRRKNIRTQQFFQGEEKEVPQLMKLIKRKSVSIIFIPKPL